MPAIIVLIVVGDFVVLVSPVGLVDAVVLPMVPLLCWIARNTVKSSVIPVGASQNLLKTLQDPCSLENAIATHGLASKQIPLHSSRLSTALDNSLDTVTSFPSHILFDANSFNVTVEEVVIDKTSVKKISAMKMGEHEGERRDLRRCISYKSGTSG